MFEAYNRTSDTVKEGIKIADGTENWISAADMVDVTGGKCYGFISGKNRLGQFGALVIDLDGTIKAVYIPKWYLPHFEALTTEELNFLKSGADVVIEKRSYGKGNNTYTYDVFLIDYKGNRIHI